MTQEETTARQAQDAKAVQDRELKLTEEKNQEVRILKERAKVNLTPERANILDRTHESKGNDAVVNAIGIYDMARSYQNEFKNEGIDLQKAADDFVKLGSSERDFGKHITDLLSQRQQKQLANSFNGANPKDRAGVSISRIINSLAPGSKINADRDLGFIKDYAEQNGISLVGKNGGTVIPLEIIRDQQRALITSSATSAGNLVATNLLATEMIPLARNLAIVDQLGVRVLPNLIGNQAIPVQTAAASGDWMTDEITGPTVSDLTTGQKTLQPKTYKVGAAFSRLASLNTTPGIERLAIDDCIAVANLAKDKAFFHGTGTAQPVGIENTALVGLGTVKTAFTYADMVAMETSVKNNNLGNGSTLAYVTTPTIADTLKTTLRAVNVPGYIWDNNVVNGYKSVASNQINSGFVFFGEFEQGIIGEWGGLELVYNPFTGNGAVIYVSAYLTMDVAIRYAKAFSYYKPI